MDLDWKHSWRRTALWIAVLGLAAALRAYHLMGFVVNNDEGHWLLYALDKRLLLEPFRNSYPRPDLLFAVLVSATIKVFGPNELALRLWPMVAGTLSLVPLAALISRITDDRLAGAFGAAFLAVLPLHVYFSATGTPDTIALFLGLCALVFLMRARQTKASTDFLGMGLCLALALMMKATALYGWAFMVVAGAFLFEERKLRHRCYQSLALAVVPLLVVTVAICAHSHTLSFFREPGVTENFGFTAAKFWLELRYLAGLYEALLLAAAIGAGLAIRRAVRRPVADRTLWVWLLPLANLAITPIFRGGRAELLWLIPTVCLFAAVAVRSLPGAWATRGAGAVMAILAVGSFLGVPLPYPGRAKASSDYTSAVLGRPSGWPSRDVVRWLTAHTATNDVMLFTAYTFTDPLLLELSGIRRVIPNGAENWGLLRDPANRVKYVIFTQDYRAYVPSFARYAEERFVQPVEAQFSGYGIYDCQKAGQFVAYPDAYDSRAPYVREGLEFLRKQELEQAVAAFERAREIDPNEPVSSVNLALLYYRLDRDEAGITQCEQNIHAAIEPAISYGVLGQIRERQGDLAAAETAYEQSLSLDPRNPTTAQLLANLKARRAAK
jgi:hypothetical protein